MGEAPLQAQMQFALPPLLPLHLPTLGLYSPYSTASWHSPPPPPQTCTRPARPPVPVIGTGAAVGTATRRRTVHLFAVNPYGGKPDHRSHLEGRVRNVDEVVSRSFSPCVCV